MSLFTSDALYVRGLSGIGAIGDLLGLRSPVVFCLHSVVGEGSEDFAGSMAITDKFLEAMIVDFRRRKIDIVSLSEALHRLENRIGGPFVCLTFDDGYRDNFDRAYPVLKRHGAPFTIFLTTGLVDRDMPMWWDVIERAIASADIVRWGEENIETRTKRQKRAAFAKLNTCFCNGAAKENKVLLEKFAADNPALRLGDGCASSLTWAMVREMSASGLAEFGCHTISHPMLNRLGLNALEEEIGGCRARLRACAGLEARYFAYPFGRPHEVGPWAAHVVEKSGFQAAFTTVSNVLAPDALRSPFALPRIMLTKKAQAPVVTRAYVSGIPARLRKRLDGNSPIATQPLRRIEFEAPVFSLVVATVGRAREIVRCLESVACQTLQHVEVIIVDQNADGRLDAIVSGFAGRLRLWHVRAERGLSRARNLGLARAHGTFVGFPDDDCWYPPDLLAQLYSRFLADPRLAGLTVRCTDGAGHMAAGKHDERAGDLTRANVWERGVGATMFVRRAVLLELGGFDENLGLGAPTPFQSGEETDLLLRALSGGYLVRYDPRLEVFHPLEDLETPRAALKAWSYGLGMGRVLRLHRYRLSSLLGHVATPVAGALIAWAMNKPSLARIRLARALARREGWRWDSATKRPLDPPAWLAGPLDSEKARGASKAAAGGPSADHEELAAPFSGPAKEISWHA